MIVYKFDGTKEGLLTCLYHRFVDKQEPEFIYSTTFQPTFDCSVIEIQTEKEQAQRVKKGLFKLGGVDFLTQLFAPLRSYDGQKENVVFQVAALCLKNRKNVLDDYSDPLILYHYDLCRKISNEAHRIKGFLRFTECRGGYYAEFEPDNDILDIIAPHFLRRFPTEKLIIRDKKRNLIAACNGKECKIAPCDATFSIILAEDELTFRSLFKTYFNAVNIESRKNKKLQDNYLPRRYRRNMTEFN